MGYTIKSINIVIQLMCVGESGKFVIAGTEGILDGGF